MVGRGNLIENCSRGYTLEQIKPFRRCLGIFGDENCLSCPVIGESESMYAPAFFAILDEISMTRGYSREKIDNWIRRKQAIPAKW
jgi:hypothetical protein